MDVTFFAEVMIDGELPADLLVLFGNPNGLEVVVAVVGKYDNITIADLGGFTPEEILNAMAEAGWEKVDLDIDTPNGFTRLLAFNVLKADYAIVFSIDAETGQEKVRMAFHMQGEPQNIPAFVAMTYDEAMAYAQLFGWQVDVEVSATTDEAKLEFSRTVFFKQAETGQQD